MESFGLLVGHLVGDYVLQTDEMARRKRTSSAMCWFHCYSYALAVWLFSFWWLPFWALPVVMLLHFPVDRWGIVPAFMRLNGQSGFLTKLSPWSAIVVDNTYHLACLWLIQVTVSGAWSLSALAGPLFGVAVLLALNVVGAELDLWPSAGEAPDATDAYPAGVGPADGPFYLLECTRPDGQLVRLHLRPGEDDDLLLFDPLCYAVREGYKSFDADPRHFAWYGKLFVLMDVSVDDGRPARASLAELRDPLELCGRAPGESSGGGL